MSWNAVPSARAVGGAGFFNLGRGVGQHGAEARAGFKQFGGLEPDHAQIALYRDVGVMHVHQLQDFALGDDVGRLSQHLKHPHAVPTETIIWKAREYRKSPTSTLAALPNKALAVGLPRRREDSSTTSSCSSVAVWMNSTTAASSKRAAWSKPSALANRQHELGPHALATCVDDVVGDLVDQRDV